MHLISATSVLIYLKPNSPGFNFQKLRQHDNFRARLGKIENKFGVIGPETQTTTALKRSELIFGLQHLAIFCWYRVKPDIATFRSQRETSHVVEPHTFKVKTVTSQRLTVDFVFARCGHTTSPRHWHRPHHFIFCIDDPHPL